MARLSSSKRKRQQKELAELADGATRYVAAVRRGDEEGRTLYWRALVFAKARARSEGCTPGQMLQAVRNGRVLPAEREARKADYLESVVAGLPEDLAGIIRGG